MPAGILQKPTPVTVSGVSSVGMSFASPPTPGSLMTASVLGFTGGVWSTSSPGWFGPTGTATGINNEPAIFYRVAQVGDVAGTVYTFSETLGADTKYMELEEVGPFSIGSLTLDIHQTPVDNVAPGNPSAPWQSSFNPGAPISVGWFKVVCGIGGTTASAFTPAWNQGITADTTLIGGNFMTGFLLLPSTASLNPVTASWGGTTHSSTITGASFYAQYIPFQRPDTPRVSSPHSTFFSQSPLRSDPVLLTTAQLEDALLGSADTAKRYAMVATHVDRRQVPQQRAYVSDPSLLNFSQLEMGLLGGADTPQRYRTPATHTDRRLVPQQRSYFASLAELTQNEQLGYVDRQVRYFESSTHVDRRYTPSQWRYISDPTVIPGVPPDQGLSGLAQSYANPAAYQDRRLVPQQRAYVSDPSVLSTAQLENEMLGGAETWKRVQAADHADRTWFPQQRAYVSDLTSLLSVQPPTVVNLGSGEYLQRLYHMASLHVDRRFVPQQRQYISDPSFIVPPVITDATSFIPSFTVYNQNLASAYADRRMYPQQRPYVSDPALLTSSLLEGVLLTSIFYSNSGSPYQYASLQVDRREYPQQRPYVSDVLGLLTPVTPDPKDLSFGVGGTYWQVYNTAATYTDRRLVPQQRDYKSVPGMLDLSLLENELLGSAMTQQIYNIPAYADRRQVPQQRMYYSVIDPTAVVGTGQLQAWWGDDPDANFIANTRRLVGDPSALPSFVDPLKMAYGVGGVYWNLYNRAATHTDRRRAPEQRRYISDPSTLAASNLADVLLGADERSRRIHQPSVYYERTWRPQQRAYISDPSIQGSSLLESPLIVNRLLDRYYTAAVQVDRRQFPQQRPYISVPGLLGAAQYEMPFLGNSVTWLQYNVAASHASRVPNTRYTPRAFDPNILLTSLLESPFLGSSEVRKVVASAAYTDRRLYPQQRGYVSDPRLLFTALLEPPLIGQASVFERYRSPSTHVARSWSPQQSPRSFDPDLLSPRPTDPILSSYLGTLQRYSQPATHVPRIWWPQQRLLVSDPAQLVAVFVTVSDTDFGVEPETQIVIAPVHVSLANQVLLSAPEGGMYPEYPAVGSVGHIDPDLPQRTEK